MIDTPYKTATKAWLQEIMDHEGITVTEVSRRAGVNHSTLTRFMNNPQYKPNLSATTIQKIASAFSRPMPSPAGGNTASLPAVNPTSTVKVLGAAAAGMWKDVSLLADEFLAHEEIPVIADHRYAGRRQYALRVEGNSINRVIRDGEYAICVSFGDLGSGLKTGQYVHVERSRGGLQEVTIKKVVVDEDSVELWPDSDDPRFQEPIIINSHEEDTEVTIRGLVIGSFRHFG